MNPAAVQNVARPTSSHDTAGSAPHAPFGTLDVALARALEPYLHWVARSSRWAWTDLHGRLVESGTIDRQLRTFARRAQPTIVTYYIADALGVATLGLMHVEFRRLMSNLRCLVDDTVTGRASGALIEHLGGRFALLPRPGDAERVRGVYEVIENGGSCAFPVDGGGPYRRVGTGVIGLAAALRATIVPLAVRATPATVFAPRSRVRVPLPRCRVVAAMGDELRIVRGTDRRAAAMQLQATLDALSQAVRVAR